MKEVEVRGHMFSFCRYVMELLKSGNIDGDNDDAARWRREEKADSCEENEWKREYW